jgi:hypothetical protein
MGKLADSKGILTNAEEFLQEHGYEIGGDDPKDKLRELIIPTLTHSRNTQSSLYNWQPPHSRGVFRMFKNLVLGKIKNIVVAILEKPMMKQQKYNELMYQAVIELAKENEALKDSSSTHD